MNPHENETKEIRPTFQIKKLTDLYQILDDF